MNEEAGYENLRKGLSTWEIPPSAVDMVRDRARESLSEVKSLIDHYDNVASRMLTVVAFLTAAASLVFQRFAADHGWPTDTEIHHLIVGATYASFLAFLFMVVIAACSVFRALLPKFTEPPAWQRGFGGGKAVGEPYSPLFFRGIRSIGPDQWGAFFAGKTLAVDSATVSDSTDLDAFYAKSSIFEAYLVAADVEKKKSAIDGSVSRLNVAMWFLLAFVVLFAATTITVPVDSSNKVPPSNASASAAASPTPTETTRPNGQGSRQG